MIGRSKEIRRLQADQCQTLAEIKRWLGHLRRTWHGLEDTKSPMQMGLFYCSIICPPFNGVHNAKREYAKSSKGTFNGITTA
jgi:hypothetical protein